ncbi:GQ67_03687T0 [Komagataella phaffii]|nr:GQ67_03687T0 [Komagataella phaffii]AOA69059.1 GQ68_03659T0 [Komagataella phaffii GS115]
MTFTDKLQYAYHHPQHLLGHSWVDLSSVATADILDSGEHSPIPTTEGSLSNPLTDSEQEDMVQFPPYPFRKDPEQPSSSDMAFHLSCAGVIIVSFSFTFGFALGRHI